MPDTGKLVVVALGGNVLVRDAEHESIPHQYETVQSVAPYLIDLVEQGWRLVLTHGNGPQVGFILRRSELAIGEVAPVPLDYVVGDTQGAIGYMFLKALGNELRRRAIDKAVVAVVTQTVVAADDPAFDHPTKPVGSFMEESAARRFADSLGWTVAQDGDRGWRRTVPSPLPVGIVEVPAIRALCDSGAIVVAAGGGGVPVTRDAHGDLVGVEAVVDKDLASAMLAVELGADALVIPTGVEAVAVNFGTAQQRWLSSLTLADAAALVQGDQLGEGSMRPKVEALMNFLRRCPNGTGIITSPERIGAALGGNAGTRIEH
ncbi:MAG: carbamate kinase [Acidimicrobiales bacterium]